MTGAHYPTVTIYNHIDVQPAQEPQWQQDPFAFQNQGGIYRGRGATDDKGPALSALFGARFAIDQGVPINIRFLWELEEEIGSPHFAAGLKHRAEVPRPDSVVVSDTIWIAKGRPAMPYGLRGIVAARLTLKTGSKDAHSGVTGGAARNPLAELWDPRALADYSDCSLQAYHHRRCCFLTEPWQNIHLPLSKKKPSGTRNAWVSCQCLVLVRSARDAARRESETRCMSDLGDNDTDGQSALHLALISFLSSLQ